MLPIMASAYSTVKKGSKGADVKTLQTMLNAVDNAGLTVDGDFGSATLTAVKKGQQIATIAKSNIGGDTMLHLELYLGTASGSLTNKSNKTFDYVTKKNYTRRRDLINPEFVLKLF